MAISKQPIEELSLGEILSGRYESNTRDFKSAVFWEEKREEFVKDLIAFANTRGGGELYVGWNPDDEAYSGLSEAQLKSFDSTIISEQVNKYASSPVELTVTALEYEGKQLVRIKVKEFTSEPILFGKMLHEKGGERILAREGDLWIRDNAATVRVSTASQMRDLLERALEKKANDIANSVYRIVKGLDEKEMVREEDKYEKDVRDFLEYVQEKDFHRAIADRGYSSVVMYPRLYEKHRIESLSALRGYVESSEILLRGWPFPNVDEMEMYAHGVHNVFIEHVGKFTQVWQMGQSGHFAFEQVFLEDGLPVYAEYRNKALFVEYIVEYFTEVFVFAAEFYGTYVGLSDSLVVDVTWHGLKDRKLLSREYIHRDQYDIAQSDEVHIELNLTIDELKASWREQALDAVERVLEVFGAEVSRGELERIQERFLK
jgi:uncharacterized protein (DUF2267 family)